MQLPVWCREAIVFLAQTDACTICINYATLLKMETCSQIPDKCRRDKDAAEMPCSCLISSHHYDENDHKSHDVLEQNISAKSGPASPKPHSQVLCIPSSRVRDRVEREVFGTAEWPGGYASAGAVID